MKSALLIDGGHLRACAKAAGHTFDVSFIERFASRCISQEEYLFRVLYYDSPLYRGRQTQPISKAPKEFKASDTWLNDLAKIERFAVRRGTLAFRGWKLKGEPPVGRELEDGDFSPVFEQKGVDMRVGLDIATISDRRSVDQIILVSGDTDMIPAMKHARKAGVEIRLIQLPGSRALHDQLLAHSDTVRTVEWPT